MCYNLIIITSKGVFSMISKIKEKLLIKFKPKNSGIYKDFLISTESDFTENFTIDKKTWNSNDSSSKCVTFVGRDAKYHLGKTFYFNNAQYTFSFNKHIPTELSSSIDKNLKHFDELFSFLDEVITIFYEKDGEVISSEETLCNFLINNFELNKLPISALSSSDIRYFLNEHDCINFSLEKYSLLKKDTSIAIEENLELLTKLTNEVKTMQSSTDDNSLFKSSPLSEKQKLIRKIQSSLDKHNKSLRTLSSKEKKLISNHSSSIKVLQS